MYNYRGKRLKTHKDKYQTGGRRVDTVPEGYNPLKKEGNRDYYNKVVTLPEAQATNNTGGGAAYDQFLKSQLGSGVTTDELVNRKYISRDAAAKYQEFYKPSEDIVYTERGQQPQGDQSALFNEFYRGNQSNYSLYRPSRQTNNPAGVIDSAGTLDVYGNPVDSVYVSQTGSRDSATPNMSNVRRIPMKDWENIYSGGSTELQNEAALANYFKTTPSWSPQGTRRKGGYMQPGGINRNLLPQYTPEESSADFDLQHPNIDGWWQPQMNQVQKGLQAGIIEPPKDWEGDPMEWYNYMNSQPEQKDKKKNDWMTPLGIGLMGSRAILSEIAGRVERGRQNNVDALQQRMLGYEDEMPIANYQDTPYNLYAKYGGKLQDWMRPFNDHSEMRMDRRLGGIMQRGGSIVDYLNKKGQDSSFEKRRELFKSKYGNEKYTGTAEQNLRLLGDLQSPKMNPASPERRSAPITKPPLKLRQPSTIEDINLFPTKRTAPPPTPSRAAQRVGNEVGNADFTPTVTQGRVQKPTTSPQKSGSQAGNANFSPTVRDFPTKKQLLEDGPTKGDVTKAQKIGLPDFSGTPNLESGFVIDKRSNTGYIVKNGKVQKEFPLLTGKNVELNSNTYSMDQLDRNPKLRNTPTGFYDMVPGSGTLYGNEFYDMKPLAVPGKLAPNAVGLAIHSSAKGPGIPDRSKLYAMSPEQRAASYGCTNLEECNLKLLRGEFPKGDTTVVIDPKKGMSLSSLGISRKYGGKVKRGRK